MVPISRLRVRVLYSKTGLVVGDFGIPVGMRAFSARLADTAPTAARGEVARAK